MKINVAKHYWKDGENATWEVSDRFDREIFQYIKNNYSKLIYEKVSSLKMNSKYIYFFYEKKKDIYGRDITELIAYQCFRKTDVDFNKYHSKESLEFLILDREDLYVVGGLVIFVILFYLTYHFFLEKKNIEIKPTNSYFTSEILKIV